MRVPLRTRKLSTLNKAARLAWRSVWVLLFRPSPRMAHGWRRFLLRLFGARMGRGTFVYPSVQVWAPWNLEMHDHSCLSHFVDCYCVDRITIGYRATVSQYAFLCTASHAYNRPGLPLVTAPIVVGDHAWVAADVFVGPGVTVGEGAVVAARSTVTRAVPPWVVVAGAPPTMIRQRDRGAFLEGVDRKTPGDD